MSNLTEILKKIKSLVKSGAEPDTLIDIRNSLVEQDELHEEDIVKIREEAEKKIISLRDDFRKEKDEALELLGEVEELPIEPSKEVEVKPNEKASINARSKSKS